MKIYVSSQGITFVGKAWEITNILKQYSKQYETVADWQQKVLRMVN